MTASAMSHKWCEVSPKIHTTTAVTMSKRGLRGNPINVRTGLSTETHGDVTQHTPTSTARVGAVTTEGRGWLNRTSTRTRHRSQMGPPGFHTTARELQTCTFHGPCASKTPPKFHERTPKRENKNKNCGGRGKKKARNFGPPPFGPHPSGPHPSGPYPTLWVPHPSEPTFPGLGSCFFCPVCHFYFVPNVVFFFPFVFFFVPDAIFYFVPTTGCLICPVSVFFCPVAFFLSRAPVRDPCEGLTRRSVGTLSSKLQKNSSQNTYPKTLSSKHTSIQKHFRPKPLHPEEKTISSTTLSSKNGFVQ